jgi:hypothetical protein
MTFVVILLVISNAVLWKVVLYLINEIKTLKTSTEKFKNHFPHMLY